MMDGLLMDLDRVGGGEVVVAARMNERNQEMVSPDVAQYHPGLQRDRFIEDGRTEIRAETPLCHRLSRGVARRCECSEKDDPMQS